MDHSQPVFYFVRILFILRVILCKSRDLLQEYFAVWAENVGSVGIGVG